MDIPPGLIQNPTDRTQRYDMVNNADTDSAAELEHKVWEDACAWKCQYAPANIPPGLVQNPPTDIIRTHTENDEYPEKFGRGECIDSSLHPPWICSGHQHCWGDGDMQNYDNTAIAGLYPKTMDCLQTEDCLPHAVCYDSVCLMPLIRINMFLFSDGDDTANTCSIEYDKDYDGSPAGLLGCLPRRLYWPWSLDGMAQYQAKINGPYLDILPRMTLNDGGRWDVRISITPPATHARRGPSLALIGRRTSVGGSAAPADWPCALSPADSPPGGIWIGFKRRTVEHRQSIVVVSVTGSLISPTLFSRRDANCICRPSILRENCDTDWSLPLLDHTEGGAMDADGFSIVDNRAGITFGVELDVPWDAPEMAINLSSTGTVPLRNVPDVFGMSGRCDSATESRILQGRDARSVRVLVPDCRGLDQNFHDVTVVDMGDLPESKVSIPELSELAKKWPPAVIAHMRPQSWRR